MENKEPEIKQNGNPNVNPGENQESSPSSSSSSIQRNEEISNANVDGNANVDQGQVVAKKKKTVDESSNSLVVVQGQVQGQGQADQEGKEASLHSLPPEMLTKILGNVDTKTLFKCRLLSKKWMEICSRILTTRSDAFVHFNFERDDQTVLTARKIEGKSRSLKDFLRDMKNSELESESKNCPYASFSFYVATLSFFDHDDWIQLLRDFAPTNPNSTETRKSKISKIKFLEFRFTIHDLDSLMVKLRDLLVNEIPYLEEFSYDNIADGPIIKLFPPSQKNPVQLPHLKVFTFRYYTILRSPGIVSDILGAAVNLRSIRVLNPLFHSHQYNSFIDNKMQRALCGIFQFLHSCGKLHLLQNAGIQVNPRFLSEAKMLSGQLNSDFSLAFQLHYLNVEAVVSENPNSNANPIDPTFIADASNFISNLLESSKNTLRKLDLGPLGFLHGLILPKFVNLTALALHQPPDSHLPFFLPGTRSKEIFPAVLDLDFQVLDCSTAFPQDDSIPRLSNVKKLCCLINRNTKFTEAFIRTLTLLCPNLTNFQIKKDMWSESQRLKMLTLLRSGDQALRAPQLPSLRIVYGDPQIPQINQNPQIPQFHQIPQNPQAPRIPQIFQIPQFHQIPQIFQAAQNPQLPQNPQIFQMLQILQAAQSPRIQQIPQAAQILRIPHVFQVPQIPQIPQNPQNQQVGQIDVRNHGGGMEPEWNEFKFSQVGPWIWTHMKELPLESLQIDVDVDADAGGIPALESCFTGISKENCRRLDALKAAGRLVKIQGSGSGDWIISESGSNSESDSELKALTKREHASILDMKDLKHLRINPYSGNTNKWLDGEEFLTKQISWITQEFAFKLMPQLELCGKKPPSN